MDRKVVIFQRILGLLLTLLLSSLSVAFTCPVTKIDFLSNIVCTDRFIYNGSAPYDKYSSVEMGEGQNGAVCQAIAYKRGNSIQVQIKIISAQAIDENGNPLHNLIVNGTTWATGSFSTYDDGKFDIPQQNYAINSNSQPITVNGPSGGFATITLSGFPNHVRGGRLALRVRMTGTDQFGTPHSSNNWYYVDFYLVEDTPKESMATPWRETLWDVTRCAATRSGAYDVKKYLTQNLFFLRRWAYSGVVSTQTSIDLDDDPYEGSFGQTNFTNLLDPLQSDNQFRLSYSYNLAWQDPIPQSLSDTTYINGNCADVNSHLALLFNTAGKDAYIQRISTDTPISGEWKFTSNPACLIGSDPANSIHWIQVTWGWHQLVVESSALNPLIHDVCAAQKRDLTGAIYENAPTHWILQSYWQSSAGGFDVGLVIFAANSNAVLLVNSPIIVTLTN